MANELELLSWVTVDDGTEEGTKGQVHGVRTVNEEGAPVVEYLVDTLDGFMRWYPYAKLTPLVLERPEHIEGPKEEEIASEPTSPVQADVPAGEAAQVDATDQPQDGEVPHSEADSETDATGVNDEDAPAADPTV